MDLRNFLQRHEVDPGKWDLLLMGDGSGTYGKDAGGFATFIFDRDGTRRHIIGGMSHTTINTMELMAYIAAVRFHYFELKKGRLKQGGAYDTHIFTDSTSTAQAGNREVRRKSNQDLWHWMAYYETVGYKFTFHHVTRNSTPMHDKADELAGEVRRQLLKLRMDKKALYDMMPYCLDEQGDKGESKF